MSVLFTSNAESDAVTAALGRAASGITVWVYRRRSTGLFEVHTESVHDGDAEFELLIPARPEAAR